MHTKSCCEVTDGQSALVLSSLAKSSSSLKLPVQLPGGQTHICVQLQRRLPLWKAVGPSSTTNWKSVATSRSTLYICQHQRVECTHLITCSTSTYIHYIMVTLPLHLAESDYQIHACALKYVKALLHALDFKIRWSYHSCIRTCCL